MAVHSSGVPPLIGGYYPGFSGSVEVSPPVLGSLMGLNRLPDSVTVRNLTPEVQKTLRPLGAITTGPVSSKEATRESEKVRRGRKRNDASRR